jgi:CRP-like cAMP-binding protein
MHGIPAVYDENTTIFSPFSSSRDIFMIDSGYVFAYNHDDDGKRRIHLIYGPGSYFPVLTAFTDRPQRSSYETLCRVTATRYKRTDFTAKLEHDLAFSNLILQKTVTQLGIFADIVINLHTTRLDDKLLNRLCNLAGSFGDEERVLPFRLRHHHLADMLGVERESVSRALLRLKKLGLVQINKEGYLQITR